MIDVQNQPDHRNIRIDKVGVKNIRYPVTVKDKAKGSQRTVASINMYVDLPHDYKGTHMSRFIEILSEYRHQISIENIATILEEMKKRLNAKSAHMEITFPYFIEKEAPVTKTQGLMEYVCTFKGSLQKRRDLIVGLKVPVTTVCPCSKEISDFGAHNQRSEVNVECRFKKFFWIEDLIDLIEKSASSEVYSVLKRSDEKFVTEKGYLNPMFVEDLVREIALKLDADENITWFSVDSENFESIHNHSAYAHIERDKTGGKRFEEFGSALRE
jgi:GTP cyclohydrolase I